MKLFSTLIIIFWIQVTMPAQPYVQWQKTFGGSYLDEASKAVQTTDGGYIVAGKVASNNGDVTGNHGGNDFWLLKLDSVGEIIWKKALGGSNNDWPYSIKQTVDGGYIAVGFTQSNNGDVFGFHGDLDGWVVKLNIQGDIEWQRCLGGSSRDEIWSITQTIDGGYILAGTSGSTDGDVSKNQGLLDFWVVKLDSFGAILWQKTYGGSDVDIAYSIRQVAEGGYIVIGETSSYDGDVLGNHGNADFWVLKINDTGVIDWQKALGGVGAEIPRDIIQTSNEEYVLVGYTGSINTGDVQSTQTQLGLFDFWIVKLNQTGQLIWQKVLGGTEPDRGRSIVHSGDGGFIVAGETSSINGDVVGNNGGVDVWVVKISTSGDVIWQNTLGGTKPEICYSIEPTSDSGFILAGYAWSNDGDVSGVQGYNDLWIIKLSPESVNYQEIFYSNALKLSIHPNPAHQTISLQIPANDLITSVLITDLLGRKILQQNGLGIEKINIDLLPKGLYLITANTASGLSCGGRFQKE